MPLADRYRITRAIKRGGMAEILEAYVQGDSGFERRVAIKRMLPGRESDPKFVRSFIDEARINSQLHHANIVAVFDFGITPEGPILVLEHVDGLDAASMCKKAHEAGVKVPPEIALAICADVARALDYAHRAVDSSLRPMGIVHRDVSPENVLISYEGDVKLTDFGIAFALRRLEETRVGVAKGKLEFMSPEQLRAQDIDARTDVFALGCVLHFMLTGVSPVAGERATWEAVGERKLDPALPDDVARLVEKSTRIDRAQRHATAGELAREAANMLADRRAGDPRIMMQAWASRWRPGAPAPKPKHRAGELIELALIAGSDNARERRFESVLIPPAEAEVLRAEPPSPRETEILDRKRRGGKLPPQIRPESLEAAMEDTRASDDPLIGATIHGFKIVELVAQGRHATTYRAQHAALDRECAISVINWREDLDETLAKRLFRDMEAIARLAPPNVVVADDCGFAPDGRPFILTKPVKGRPLSRVLREEAPLEGERAWSIARAIASALALPHDSGVAHGELGPNAVMISGEPPRERVDLLDVGLAGALKEGTGAEGDLRAIGEMITAMVGEGGDLLAGGLRALAAAGRTTSANAVVSRLDAIAPAREGNAKSSNPHESLPGDQVAEMMPVSVSAVVPQRSTSTLWMLVAIGLLLAVLAIAAVVSRQSQPPPPVGETASVTPQALERPGVKALTATVAAPEPKTTEPKAPPPRKEKRAVETAPPPPAVPVAADPDVATETQLAERLKRVAETLAASEKKIAAAELDKLESAYLELRAALDRSPGEEQRKALEKRIDALEKRLVSQLR